MYHPGKILGIYRTKDKEVKSSDETTQATVEMWDDNLLTLLVEAKIAKDLKENDIVLVDYSPVSEKVPVAKQIIVKIIYKKKAKEIWATYKDYAREKKREAVAKHPIKSYMG